MKKLIILIGFLLIILIIGCANNEDVLDYVPIPIGQIPNQYSDDVFSVKGFLENKENYDNQSVNIKGIVSYKYKCPPCPPGSFCKMCANNHINLADPVEKITPNNRIVINFFKDEEIYKALKLGEEITINIHFTLEKTWGRGAIDPKQGFFIYNYILN